MADVLSQSQIDALLNAVRSGEKDINETEEEQEKKYRKYDFYSPKKFTKDRIKMLSGIFENYTRVINSRLNTILHTTCEISVDSVEEQRYYEFSNALTDSDVLTLSDVRINGKEEVEEVPVFYYVATNLAMSMMDRMMGGEGDMDDSDTHEYTYTDLELHLYESMVKDLVEVMSVSWENYLPIDFIYNKTEINPTLVQLLGIDETVVIVDLKLEFSNYSGRISICLPGVILTNIFTEISREAPVRRLATDENSEEIFDRLRDSDLEIKAELGNVNLALSDIYHLREGDVIDLGRNKDSMVYLEIGGYRWFMGQIGVHKKNMAVKIEEMCYQQAEKGASS